MASVVLGAFAAHGLKGQLSAELFAAFETGIFYQFIHTLAIMVCGLLLFMNLSVKSQKYFLIAAICFIIGILCFSGSLYALALTGIKWFGPITPLGGLLFIIGWGLFSFAAFNINEVTK
ncbi:hypothetical protein BCU68_07790 [Vibrio sp. 10N.286.49.B3]|uniref:DUF423 domain-containing protein n=1 Tax=Vibrio sp. 10N.286.49.B3 TaxID=1880855 RepID=UPI000C84102A|nr:DUF423 domain-containing protein [Vibrio sp. 10N.286.49.B3]PMH37507.1 hypothetical protein BCU68_07790 [Vibrio sp. 10N.286.49.B3]